MEEGGSRDDGKVYAVIIVGSGFAGLCAAIALRKSGENDFLILERAASVGGTWRDNAYPGCACDIPAVLYSFSFEQNADWSRKYPTQPELYAYLKDVAKKHDLMSVIRFEHDMQFAAYDDAANLWTVQTSQGMFRARTIISAVGGLSTPATPRFPGMERFGGPTFHSAAWNHDVDLTGKRVAVIGTGASAIQIVPGIAQRVASLEVYQRTPAWVVPRRDRAIRNWEKTLRRTPLRNLFRWGVYWSNELTVVGIVVYPALMRLAKHMALHHMKRQLPDPALCAKLTPDYVMGCKRILVSDDYYPAFSRPNVHLHTGGIREITERGVISDDGDMREVDAIVYATGFQATDNPIAAKVRGRGGMLLSEVWRDGEAAYLGTLIHGFPNLFMITGPNTGIGHTSVVFMIESQVHYIMACMKLMATRGFRRIEVRSEAQDEFNIALQQRMQKTAWTNGGCKSWYQNKNGKVTTLWPGFTFQFWRRLRRPRVEHLLLS